MDLLEIIKGRRSIRKFKPIDIPYERILEILEAARWAPSSGNLQNWRFIIVKDPEKKEKLANYALRQHFIAEAPAVIVVCSDTRLVEEVYGERGRFYAIQNVAAAIQNILLYAHYKGLGTCWIGAFHEDKIKELLEIPESIEVHALIPIGYPAENPKPPERLPLHKIVYFERWGNKEYMPRLYPLIERLKDIKKEFEKSLKALKEI